MDILITLFLCLGVILGIKTLIEDYRDNKRDREQPFTKAPSEKRLSLGTSNRLMLENQSLKERVVDLEDFLMWCIKEGGTIQDFVLALHPDKPLEEIMQITEDYTEKYRNA